MKDKRTLIVIVGVVGLLVAVLGITYAYFTANITGNENATSVIVGTAKLGLTFDSGDTITGSDIIPGWSETKTFSVTNTSNVTMYYSINWSNITNTFVNNGDLIYALNTSKIESIMPYTNSAILNGIEIKVGETHSYTLTVTFKNLDKLQDENQGKTFMGKIEIKESSNVANAIEVDKDENMIPIMWNGDSWVKADESNTDVNYSWYDYNTQKWANIVLVTDTNRETYKTATPGTVIPETDILAYFVYIPRYKYKLFNTNNEGVPEQVIEVEFEKVGTTKSMGSTNGTWLTHPAFTFGDSELKGIWVGKFTTSSDESSACYITPTVANCDITTVNPRIKPNQDMWRMMRVAIAFTVSQSFKSNDIYGISSSNIDSHMMKNMEWGAAAYLSQSQYGKQGNSSYSGANKEVYTNNYREEATTSRLMTGCSAGAPSTAVATTCANVYSVSGAGTGASTTGTIYGVYDMSGGAWEYVMGNMVDTTGTFYSSGAGFLSIPDAKYYDVYANDSLNSTTTNYQGALNPARGLLGDATRETLSIFGTSITGGWYGDYSVFPHETNSWFLRGNHASGDPSSAVGIFANSRTTGGRGSVYSFRTVLVVE